MSESKKYVGLNVTKPVGFFYRGIKTNPKTFFFKLSKAIASGVQLDFEEALTNLTEAVIESELEDKVGALAWLLIYTALLSAVKDLIQDGQDLFDLDKQPDEQKQQELAFILDARLSECEITINETFFDQPKNFPFLHVFQEALKPWLIGLGLDSLDAQALVERLPNKFVLALHLEWQKQSEQYEPIKKAINTPFTKSVGKQRQWLQYHAWLGEQVNERMFAEAFSLKQVYVRLRAYYEKQAEKHDEKERHVVCLHEELESWVKNYKADDTVRVISGGPGSGKSSFCKIFATEIAEKLTLPVLFIPLHQFDYEADLGQAIKHFIHNNTRYINGNPLDFSEGEERILVIFDGLDELSMQGKIAAKVANDFVDEVIKYAGIFISQNIKHQFLISGRDLAIQANNNKLRQAHQILHVLPYFLENTEDYNGKKHYVDPKNLLEIDQRDEWWANYSRVKSKELMSMPDNLKQDNLIEITQQPLLNYLVALSYEREQLNFNSQTTLNEVYADLLTAVFERQWEGGRRHSGVGQLEQDKFFRILEEIALAVWHGDGRTATINYIHTRCEGSDLIRYFDIFEDGAKKGVTRLLTAFYFRQAGEAEGEKTFEFTHKSFGEYLTARRLVRMLEKVQTMLDRREHDPDDGWSERDALKHWAELCGTTTIDDYLYEFIQNEVRLHQSTEWEAWQKTLVRLIESAVTNGMPMEELDYSSIKNNIRMEKRKLSYFQVMLEQSRNAEEALVAMHFACAQLTKEVLPINWSSFTACGAWIKRLQGQRDSSDNKLILKCLGYLNLKGCVLFFLDLYNAHIEGTCLEGTHLYRTHLETANLQGVNFEGAYIKETYLQGANLEGANLGGTNFEEANLGGANLQRANLQRANLEGAILGGANLEGANLEGANLQRANLEGANLEGANLQRANLQRTNLQRTNLEGVNLEGVNLQGASLQRINLERANLQGVDLQGANLEEAKFERVNLKGAYLKGVNLKGANLDGVNLDGANLDGANLLYARYLDKIFSLKTVNFDGALLPDGFKIPQN